MLIKPDDSCLRQGFIANLLRALHMRNIVHMSETDVVHTPVPLFVSPKEEIIGEHDGEVAFGCMP